MEHVSYNLFQEYKNMKNLNISKIMQNSKGLLNNPIFILQMDGSVKISGTTQTLEYSSIDLLAESNLSGHETFNTHLVIAFLKTLKTGLFNPMLCISADASNNQLIFQFVMDGDTSLCFSGLKIFETLFPVDATYYANVKFLKFEDKLSI